MTVPCCAVVMVSASSNMTVPCCAVVMVSASSNMTVPCCAVVMVSASSNMTVPCCAVVMVSASSNMTVPCFSHSAEGLKWEELCVQACTWLKSLSTDCARTQGKNGSSVSFNFVVTSNLVTCGHSVFWGSLVCLLLTYIYSHWTFTQHGRVQPPIPFFVQHTHTHKLSFSLKCFWVRVLFASPSLSLSLSLLSKFIFHAINRRKLYVDV